MKRISNSEPDIESIGLLTDATNVELMEGKILIDPEQKHHKSSDNLSANLGKVEVFFTIFKSIVGIGVLYLPKGISYSGWLNSLITFIICSIFIAVGLNRQTASHEKCGGSYSDLAEKAGGKFSKVVVQICIAASQLIFITGYMTFIVLNLNHISTAMGREFPEWTIGLVLCLIMIPLVCVRDISIFASCHIFADIIVIGSILFIVIYNATKLTNNGYGPGIIASGSIISVMRVVGIAVGAFEANAAIIPIHQQAADKRGFLNIQNSVMITVIVIYIGYGILSYLTFGTGTMGPITISMNQFKWYVEVLELFYMLALILTVMLQYYPAMEILLQYSSDNLIEGRLRSFVEYFIRSVTIVLCIMFSVCFGKSFDVILSISGNLLVIPITTIFPAYIHYRLVANTIIDKIVDIAIFCFGVLCMIMIIVLIFIDYA